MRRRARALGFLAAAALCALVAASIADGYGEQLADRYGRLRPVLVARTDLPADRVLTPTELRSAVGIRRVPARFVPPDALARAADALGRAPTALLPAGSYVLDAQLAVPEPPSRRAAGLGGRRRPVEIAVSGAAALRLAGATESARVDVVVTDEPRIGGRGRTYVAAANVPLLGLSPAGPGDPGAARATLALSRPQALKLIAAENFARQVRLLPR